MNEVKGKPEWHSHSWLCGFRLRYIRSEWLPCRISLICFRVSTPEGRGLICRNIYEPHSRLRVEISAACQLLNCSGIFKRPAPLRCSRSVRGQWC
jgi:hypothetical protein